MLATSHAEPDSNQQICDRRPSLVEESPRTPVETPTKTSMKAPHPVVTEEPPQIVESAEKLVKKTRSVLRLSARPHTTQRCLADTWGKWSTDGDHRNLGAWWGNGSSDCGGGERDGLMKHHDKCHQLSSLMPGSTAISLSPVTKIGRRV